MHNRFPFVLAAAISAALISACTSHPTRDDVTAPDAVLPTAQQSAQEAAGDNAFSAIEQATNRVVHLPQTNAGSSDAGLANDATVTAITSTNTAAPALIWQRLQNSFSFPSCAPDSDAHDWAVWYGKRQDYMDRVLQRAEPWLYYIEEQIRARGLPSDLVLLPIVESAFDPFATSHGRAVGTWQFVRGTARDYGLAINDWYDGRRDVYAATTAALDYLQYLFNHFNHDWRLALAAYNGGQNRVKRALKRYNGDSESVRPKDLRLPRETRSYAPKLHGLSCLIRAPQEFGLTLPAIIDEPKITAVDTQGPLDLVIAARLAGLSITELYALNPGMSRWSTPPHGPHQLVLPHAQAAAFTQALAQLPQAQRVHWQGVTVQAGDTLSTIAARSGVTVAELMAANQLQSTVIRPGQELRLLGSKDLAPDQEYQQQLAQLQQLQGRLLTGATQEHRVRNGESLWLIARRYRVAVDDLARWNGISNTRRIHPGQRLRIKSNMPTTSTSVLASAPAHQSAPTEHRVRRGDSPWTIARRYRIALRDLLRWNNLDSDSILRPGQTLRLQPATSHG